MTQLHLTKTSELCEFWHEGALVSEMLGCYSWTPYGEGLFYDDIPITKYHLEKLEYSMPNWRDMNEKIEVNSAKVMDELATILEKELPKIGLTVKRKNGKNNVELEISIVDNDGVTNYDFISFENVSKEVEEMNIEYEYSYLAYIMQKISENYDDERVVGALSKLALSRIK